MKQRQVHIAGFVLATLVGLLVGVGSYTFFYAEGASYLSTDPASCANCHIMWPQYDAWLQSSHHNVATCQDCHLPHDFVPKYIAKADNGFRHAWAFTLQNFEEPIRIIPRNSRILQENCIGCHGALVHDILDEDDRSLCVRCHIDVGHGPYR